MNRIIIIGNGFDLAHGLKTSYKDFIDWYWSDLLQRLSTCIKDSYADGLCSFETSHSSWACSSIATNFSTMGTRSPFQQVCDMKNDQRWHKVLISSFLQEISQDAENKNWVDIETSYYEWLQKSTLDGTIVLNQHFDIIKQKLIEHLSIIQNQHINSTLIKNEIQQEIYAPLSGTEIAICKQKLWREFVQKRVKTAAQQTQEDILDNPQSPYQTIHAFNKQQRDIDEKAKNLYQKIIYGYRNNAELLNQYTRPERILLLNFNYTNMADMYADAEKNCRTLHIHGILSQKDHIIFGYGDEKDEQFKEIMSRKHNEYLRNVKSTNYTRTDHYRALLAFIENNPYQLYIMGHSCGQSDGTLLRTLFEHPNCVSIKPYFYIKNGENKYIETVQNIYRNFSDMQLMRDLVVNQRKCKPLCP